MPKKAMNRYGKLFEKAFFDRYKGDATCVSFRRTDLEAAASDLKIALPKNLGDVVYSFRYRNPLPERILKTQPKGKEWIIEGAGRAQYEFRLVSINRILPNENLVTVKIPDSTPEIVAAYSLSDEQALLAKIRYNRLIDIFLGITTYSLQNHLRTTVRSVGQIEIDEIYVGIDERGRQFVMPVQAKGGNDQISVVQAKQDIMCCVEKFPNLICRPISTQFLADDLIAMFELCMEGDLVKIASERHYRLVSSSEISDEDLIAYGIRSSSP
ncbi:MAG: endonuclease [Verrucomicrobiota bacterium]